MSEHPTQYPKRTDYKGQLSTTRYQFKHERKDVNGKKDTAATRQCLLYEPRNHLEPFTVHSNTAITAFDYLIKTLETWDTKSKELNGWSSAFFTILNARNMMQRIKYKYNYKPATLKFTNANSIYRILELENKGYYYLNKNLLSVWMAASKYEGYQQFLTLLTVVEGIAKSVLIFSIPNYKSRGNRTYRLPWETANDPMIPYRKKYIKSKMRQVQSQRSSDTIKLKQPGVTQFFKRKRKINQLTTQSADKAKTAKSAVKAGASIPTESEFHAILQELDNGSDNESDNESECGILSDNQLNVLLRSRSVSPDLVVLNEPPKKKPKFNYQYSLNRLQL